MNNITCVICQGKGEHMTYIGETQRPIRLKFNGHFLSAKNKTPDTPIGDHFIADHQDYQIQRHDILLNVQNLQKADDHPHGKICESLYIRKEKVMLNRNVSSWYII